MAGIYIKLLSATLAGASASLLAASVALLFERPTVRKKTALWLAVVGILLIIISPFFGFDVRVSVPDLNFRPLEEATALVTDAHMVPEVISVEQPGIELGRVLQSSQSVPGGQVLSWGKALSFKIADEGTITMSHPKTNNTVDCISKSQGSCTFVVDGTSSKLVRDGRLVLVLWTKSRQSNWFPQGPLIINQDGSWGSEAQVGNSQDRPMDGELVELALTLHPRDTAIPQAGNAFTRPQGNPIDGAKHVTIIVF